jgi:hypothetical protein
LQFISRKAAKFAKAQKSLLYSWRFFATLREVDQPPVVMLPFQV